MICFVIAMDKEAEPVLSAMTKVKAASIYGRKTYTGKLFGKRTAVVVCGVGKSNAAAGTQLAISLFKPERVINLGVAGGLNDKCAVGSVYAISKAVQYDFDLCQLNGTAIGTLDEYDENYIKLDFTPKFAVRKLASGDRFNDSKADYKLLTKELDADIRDMEGAAIAHVCRRAGVSVYAFKAISDKAGSGSTTEQYMKNLELCMQKISEELPSFFAAVEA